MFVGTNVLVGTSDCVGLAVGEWAGGGTAVIAAIPGKGPPDSQPMAKNARQIAIEIARSRAFMSSLILNRHLQLIGRRKVARHIHYRQP